MTRKLGNWIESYLDFTEGLKSPYRYRKWAAVSAVAAALQRRVRVRIEGQYQFANMYILLVGPPGVGKGNAVKPMQRMLRKLGSIHLAPRGITKRAFYTELESCQTTDVNIVEGTQDTHSSITAIIEEFGVFLSSKDLEFMDALADVYDNPEIWEYKTQHSGNNRIEAPNFNMLACTTPKGVRERFTDDVFEQGLPARIMMIFADDKIKVPLFKTRPKLEELQSDLVHDLEQILLLKGEYKWDPSAAETLQAWADKDLKPAPQDMRFQHYNSRRLAQLTKLCMISAAANHDDPVIYAEDLSYAKDLLLEAETVMVGAIAKLGANPLKEQIQAARRFIEVFYRQHNKPVPEFKLLRFLYNEVPVQYVGMVIEALINSGWVHCSGDSPSRLFIPTEGAKDGQETS